MIEGTLSRDNLGLLSLPIINIYFEAKKAAQAAAAEEAKKQEAEAKAGKPVTKRIF